MGKTLTGKEFAKALAEDKVEPIVMNGLAKKSEDPEVIVFSPGLSCMRWVSVPVSMIDEVGYLGKVPCKDHYHDHVLLFLKEPKEGEAAVFAKLLQGVLTTGGVPAAMPCGTGDVKTNCVWNGQVYSPGSWVCVWENGIPIKYWCQSNGTWRALGQC